MRTPEQALREARRRAAAAQVPGGRQPAGAGLEDPTASMRRLAEWAIIEPDAAEVYSTRRFGRPITALKRLLVRFLRQYFDQVRAQQSRFNARVAAHVLRLEERVEALENAARGYEDAARGHEDAARGHEDAARGHEDDQRPR